MKRGLLYLILLMAFVSCGHGGRQQKQLANERENLNSYVQKAAEAPETENELFLGFRFGMSNKEVALHLDSLLEAGKIYFGNNRVYTYDFHTEERTLIVTFHPEYYSDSLYRMDYFLHTRKGDVGTPVVNAVLAASTFEKANARGYKRFATETSLGNPVYMFIKRNLIVKFDAQRDGRMSYTNAPMEKRARDAAATSQKNKSIQTISDF